MHSGDLIKLPDFSHQRSSRKIFFGIRHFSAIDRFSADEFLDQTSPSSTVFPRMSF